MKYLSYFFRAVFTVTFLWFAAGFVAQSSFAGKETPVGTTPVKKSSPKPIELVDFDADVYAALHKDLNIPVDLKSSTGTVESDTATRSHPATKKQRHNWLSDHARNSILNDQQAGRYWLFGTPADGSIKAQAQRHPHLERDFKDFFLPMRGSDPTPLTTEEYKLSFAYYIQTLMLASTRSIKPLTSPLDPLGPKQYDPNTPWIHIPIGVLGSDDNDSKDPKSKTIGIGSLMGDSYFARKGDNTPTSPEAIQAALAARETLCTQGGAPLARTVTLDPRNPFRTLPNSADLPTQVRNLHKLTSFRLFENLGEGLCGFHGLGINPEEFVDECMRRLNTGTQAEAFEVIQHVFMDACAMAKQQRGSSFDKKNPTPLTRMFRDIFGVENENISGYSPEEVAQLFINCEETLEQVKNPKIQKQLQEQKALEKGGETDKLKDIVIAEITAIQAIKNSAIRARLNLTLCLLTDRVRNYLRARYVGYDIDKETHRIGGGYIESECADLVGNIAGVGFVIISETILPEVIHVTAKEFARGASKILKGKEGTNKTNILNQLVQLALDIQTVQKEVMYTDRPELYLEEALALGIGRDPWTTKIYFVNPEAADEALQRIFGQDSLQTFNRTTLTQYFKENINKAVEFLQERFTKRSLDFFKILSNGERNDNHDPLQQNKGQVILPLWDSQSLGKGIVLRKVQQIGYDVGGDFTSGKVVFLHLKHNHYSTLVPMDIEDDQFGRSRIFKQMILEEIHCWSDLGASVREHEFTAYLDLLRKIYPDEDVNLAL